VIPSSTGTRWMGRMFRSTPTMQRIPWSGQGEPPGPGQVPVLRQHFTEQPGDLRHSDSERWAQVLG
jgi:hypothetical protein